MREPGKAKHDNDCPMCDGDHGDAVCPRSPYAELPPDLLAALRMPKQEARLVDEQARDHIRVLLTIAVQEVLDDPSEAAPETWSEHERLAAQLGWDIWDIAAEVGTDHEIARMRDLLGR